MPDDETWNAFEKAQADDVQQKEGLGDICGAEISIMTLKVACRRVHPAGDQQHEVYINDDSGNRTVRISWVW